MTKIETQLYLSDLTNAIISDKDLSFLSKADQLYIITPKKLLSHPKYHHPSPHHSHKMVVPFFIDELTTRAFGTELALLAHASATLSPAHRGASPPNPPAYLTQCLILLLNSISHMLTQLAGAVYITQSFILLLYPMYYTLAQLACVHY